MLDGVTFMAHYVLSDIHGEGDRFHRMLERIGFSSEDTLYILGDVIDRRSDGIDLLREIMASPNMVMLLGNHEYMMLQYFRPGSTVMDAIRWNRNGNTPTLESFQELPSQDREEILSFLRTRQTHLHLELNGKKYYLVHGFPGENAHDEVWGRPHIEDENPVPDRTLLIGHTPVVVLGRDEEAQIRYGEDLMKNGDHLRILHAPGFVDLDCGCGHRIPFRALGCLRLEDGEEFYT